MIRRYYPPSDKEYVSAYDDEINVFYDLNDYFTERQETCTYLQTCIDIFEKKGRLSLGQYDTLRSIWNNLDDNFTVNPKKNDCVIMQV